MFLSARTTIRLTGVVSVLLVVSSCGSDTTRPKSDASSSSSTAELGVSFHTEERGGRCELADVEFGRAGEVTTQPLPEHLGCDELDVVVLLRDFNFDQRTDVAVLSELPASNGPLYRYWLQTTAGGFLSSQALNDALLVAPEVDAALQEIRSTSNDGVGRHARRTYVWINGQLTLKSCEQLDADASSTTTSTTTGTSC